MSPSRQIFPKIISRSFDSLFEYLRRYSSWTPWGICFCHSPILIAGAETVASRVKITSTAFPSITYYALFLKRSSSMKQKLRYQFQRGNFLSSGTNSNFNNHYTASTDPPAAAEIFPTHCSIEKRHIYFDYKGVIREILAKFSPHLSSASTLQWPGYHVHTTQAQAHVCALCWSYSFE
jgi:hypothetical protein